MQNKIHVLCKKTYKEIYNAGGRGGGFRLQLLNLLLQNRLSFQDLKYKNMREYKKAALCLALLSNSLF